MSFQGTRLSIDALIAHPLAPSDDEATRASQVGVLHSAAGSAQRCAERLRAGESLDGAWRFAVLQTLDYYRSTVARGGVVLGAQVFTAAPGPTGSAELDVAFAALAEHLAVRDGWAVPGWVAARSPLQADWYPDVPEIFREEARLSSPPAFRTRGIYITDRSLARA